MRSILPILCLAVPSFALACPDAPDHSSSIQSAIEELQRAPNEAAAQPLQAALWEFWLDAPDDVAQEMLDRGTAKLGSFDLLGAVADLSALIDYCPDYAEGYNQRAFAHFLRQDYSSALPDLDRAIELSPQHTGALTGRALTLHALGNNAAAAKDLEAALVVNPWLRERSLLPVLTAPKGEEI